MKTLLGDLFYAVKAEIEALETQIKEAVDPKTGIFAIGQWLEESHFLEQIAFVIVTSTAAKKFIPVTLTAERVRQLRLSLGSRTTERALNTFKMEIVDEDGKQISYRPVDPRFGRRS